MLSAAGSTMGEADVGADEFDVSHSDASSEADADDAGSASALVAAAGRSSGPRDSTLRRASFFGQGAYGDRSAEHARLVASEKRKADWKNWGPYVSERAWGTVREDYSEDGDAWSYFPHDQARSRAYRWNEDGLASVCNRFQNVCMGVALWNNNDPILKERLFGLTGSEGNHGEDVKELYWYLDSTPTHSYMKFLYKYPMDEYPYGRLVEENSKRSREEPEFELVDAMHDAFRAKEYFDVFVEYAKADEEDILCKITAVNKSSSRAAPIHILPQLWYRNTWSWGYVGERPHITKTGPGAASTSHRHLGERYFYGCAPVQSESGTTFAPPHNDLYTNNDTNNERLFGAANETPYVKDAFHEYIVRGKVDAVNPEHTGTKAAMHFSAVVPPEGSYVVWARFTTVEKSEPFAEFHDVMAVRQAEADQFYSSVQDDSLGDDAKLVQRQAFAGLLWSKQFYHFGVQMWLDGDPAMPKPPASRRSGRNKEWQHLYNCDVLSMPDKWEYPWYAAWDLAFHMIPISLVDPEWSKRQLVLMLREWYTHPSGQLPAYEWNFGDVNPPVHAWAVLRVYKITAKAQGTPDVSFLERCFHKLMLNFTWWVNRKDSSGRNLFEGGFLGLDNIGVFDRSNMPPGMTLDQADGTAWMGMFCLNLLSIAVELAQFNSAYQDVCSKFFEHFVALASAISGVSSVHKERGQTGLWDAETKFFYDVLRPAGGAATGEAQYVRAKSFVGLIPLFAVTTIDEAKLDRMPAFKKRMDWFIRHRSSLVAPLISWFDPKESGRATSGDAHGASTRRRLLSLVTRDKLQDVLRHMLDESKFLSPYGLRSLSREHEAEPYYFESGGISASLKYEPAESSSPMYGGNSNWRGPIWMPVNYLMIEALQQFDHYFGDAVQVECPTGSGKKMPLWDVSIEIGRRLSRLFTKDSSGHRPCNGPHETAKADDFDGLVTFYEFFNPETGAGVGASHQTGWTALVAKILQQQGRHGYAFGAAGESDGAAGAGGPSRR